MGEASDKLPEKSAEKDAVVRRGIPSAFKAFRFIVLILVLTVPGLWMMTTHAAVLSFQAWGHLRIGNWMLQNMAFPHSGLFSNYASFRWVDLYVFYELVLAVFYKLAGIRAIFLVYGLAQLLFAVSIFLLAGGWRRFWLAALVALFSQLVSGPLAPNVLTSGALLALCLNFLLRQKPDRAAWRSWMLAVAFLLWVNLDPSFLFGLIVVFLFLVVTALAQFPPLQDSADRKGQQMLMAAVLWLGVCVAATLVNPNGYHAWSTAWTELYSQIRLLRIDGLRAMQFRSWNNYGAMLLAMFACFAAGRANRRKLFLCALLAIAMADAFRFQRDVWCMVVVSAAVIGMWEEVETNGTQSEPMPRQGMAAALVAFVVIAVAVVGIMPRNDRDAVRRFSQGLPVEACEHLRHSGISGPLFNDYDWGGFLIYYLPEYPVSIDDRIGLYGEEITQQYFDVVTGTRPLEATPSFTMAHVLLLKRNSALATALTTLPRLTPLFRVEYQDSTAIIFVRN